MLKVLVLLIIGLSAMGCGAQRSLCDIGSHLPRAFTFYDRIYFFRTVADGELLRLDLWLKNGGLLAMSAPLDSTIRIEPPLIIVGKNRLTILEKANEYKLNGTAFAVGDARLYHLISDGKLRGSMTP